MNTIIYLFQASLLLIGLFGSFWLLLRKETFFQLNRALLLLIVGVVLVLPLIPIPDMFPNWDMTLNGSSVLPVNQPSQLLDFPNAVQADAALPSVGIGALENVPESIDWTTLLLLLYLAGVFLFLGRLLFQFFLLARLLQRGKWIFKAPFILVETNQHVKPFSFFHFIVYNPQSLASPALEQVCEHEAIHSRQWHSLDIMFGELLCVVLWFHPLAWNLARSIRLNLEYLADRIILTKGFEKKSYQYSLLQVALNGKNLRLTNNFNQSLIKKRIIMMNAKQSPDYLKWKYFLMVPFLLGFALVINQVNAQTSSNSNSSKTSTTTSSSVGVGSSASQSTESSSGRASTGVSATTQARSGSGSNATSNSNGNSSVMTFDPSKLENSGDEAQENIYFIVRADVDKNTLKEMKDGIAKEGFYVDFKELDYNANGLITRIKINMESDHGINGNVYADNDGQPIDGPVGFYLILRGEKRHFGTINGDPENARLPQSMIQFIQGATGYFKGNFKGN